jgi:biopolymer transport protein TolQ
MKAASSIEIAILIFLIFCSIVSWAIVVWKLRTIKAARVGNEAIAQKFENAAGVKELEASLAGAAPAPNALVLAAAMKAMKAKLGASRESILMAMQHASRNEFTRISRGMDILASIASATPFIGLLGTVLGIMATFQLLGSAKSASLNVVAPGIAAALIATAAGLLVAIPAVFAYNRLMAGIDEQQEQTEMFIERAAERLAATAEA